MGLVVMVEIPRFRLRRPQVVGILAAALVALIPVDQVKLVVLAAQQVLEVQAILEPVVLLESMGRAISATKD